MGSSIGATHAKHEHNTRQAKTFLTQARVTFFWHDRSVLLDLCVGRFILWNYPTMLQNSGAGASAAVCTIFQYDCEHSTRLNLTAGELGRSCSGNNRKHCTFMVIATGATSDRCRGTGKPRRRNHMKQKHSSSVQSNKCRKNVAQVLLSCSSTAVQQYSKACRTKSLAASGSLLLKEPVLLATAILSAAVSGWQSLVARLCIHAPVLLCTFKYGNTAGSVVPHVPCCTRLKRTRVVRSPALLHGRASTLQQQCHSY